MYALIVSLIILVAFLLILVVLAQNPKGGGLSSQFGGAGSSQIMGVKKTGDILEKLTWGFAIAILALSLSTNFFLPTEEDFSTSPNLENAADPAVPSTLAPPEGGEENSLEGLGLENEDTVN